MNTRDALHASLAITPDAPEEAARKMRAISEWVQLEDALERALRFARRRNGVVLHHWLEVAARKFFGIAGDMDMSQSHATIAEADTKTIVAELKRRIQEENDPIAARALKIPLPSPKKKGSGRVRT